MALSDWDGSVVVVTGAAHGIGRATALAMAERGAVVHASDIDADGVQALSEELERVGAPRAVAHEVDVTDYAAVSELAERVHSDDGRVDVLVNNAGVAFGAPIEDTTIEDWKRVIDVNLWGVIHGIHAFVPGMLERESGHIVNMASGLGLIGFPYVAVYCATKFAIVGLSESLNIELRARGVHVAAICPGIIRTEIVQRTPMKGRSAELREATRAFYADRGTPPSRVARDVIRTVERRRAVQVTPYNYLPLVLLKKLSVRGYQRIVGAITRRVLDAASP